MKKLRPLIAAKPFSKGLSRVFLKRLVLLLDSEERCDLPASLAKAERKQKCLRHAVFLMIVLLMLSGAGLSYCAVLKPNVFHEPNHPLMHSLSVLSLGSFIALAVFLAYLLWQRAASKRLQAEWRRLALAESHLPGPADPGPAPAPSSAEGTRPTSQPLRQEGFLKPS